MLLLRKIVFYVFLAIYLVSCPWLMMYVLGYVWSPGTEREVLKTGVISLETVPPGASVYLERRRYAQRTPTAIRGLLPGTYHLKVVLKNHEPWVRTVSVEAEKATVLDSILLLPTPLQPKELLPDAFVDLVPLLGTKWLLLAEGPQLEDLLVYDWESKRSLPVASDDSLIAGGRISWQTMVRGSAFLVMRVHGRGTDQVIRVDLEANEPALVDVTRVFPSVPRWVTWDPHTPQQLFTFHEGRVDRLDLETMAIYPKVAEQVRGYGVANKQLYVLTDDLIVERRDPHRQRIEVLLDDPETRRALSMAKPPFRLTVLSEALLLFLGDRGELIANQPPYRLVESGVQGFEFDPPHQRLLLWRKDKLGILDASALQQQESDAEPVLALSWVFHDGRDIAQAFWVHHGSHVLFRDRETVWLLDLDAAAPLTPRRLLQVRPGSSILYSETSGTLYYLDRETRRLSSIEILPRKTLPLELLQRE